MSKWKRLQQQLRAKSLADRPNGFKGITPESWLCIDCGFDTAPGYPNRAQMEEDFRQHGRSDCSLNNQFEVYTVHSHVWRAVAEDFEGCLCIGCLEKRLGRELTPADFIPGHALNEMPGTPRLLQRQGRITEFERLFGELEEEVA
jgi:hypothetical protein